MQAPSRLEERADHNLTNIINPTAFSVSVVMTGSVWSKKDSSARLHDWDLAELLRPPPPP